MTTMYVAWTGLDTWATGRAFSTYVDPVPPIDAGPVPLFHIPGGSDVLQYFGAQAGNFSYSWALTGTNLSYSGGVLSGQVTAIVLTEVDIAFQPVRTNVITFSGLSISGADWSSAVSTYMATGNRAAIDLLLFGPPATFLGGYGNDVFRAGNSNDFLLGFDGNDQLVAFGGSDYLNGGLGSDALLGGDGADLIYGENGNDTAWGGAGDDIVLLGEGDDASFGEAGADIVYGEAGSDAIQGGDGSDFIAGGSGGDFIWGQGAADYLMGEDGADTLSGGDSSDVLVGGVGADVLFGDDGMDGLFGGIGNDYYVGGGGADFFYAYHDGPIAGELDIIDGFEVAATGVADWVVLPAVYQSATTFFDASGYAWIATAVAGGTHYVAVTGATAATVQAQTIWM